MATSLIYCTVKLKQTPKHLIEHIFDNLFRTQLLADSFLKFLPESAAPLCVLELQKVSSECSAVWPTFLLFCSLWLSGIVFKCSRQQITLKCHCTLSALEPIIFLKSQQRPKMKWKKSNYWTRQSGCQTLKISENVSVSTGCVFVVFLLAYNVHFIHCLQHSL